jgi:hypothetical protein
MIRTVYFGNLQLEIATVVGKRKNIEKFIAKDIVFADITDPIVINRCLRALGISTDLAKNAKITKILTQKKIGS